MRYAIPASNGLGGVVVGVTLDVGWTRVENWNDEGVQAIGYLLHHCGKRINLGERRG
jgi:hypothetical protein